MRKVFFSLNGYLFSVFFLNKKNPLTILVLKKETTYQLSFTCYSHDFPQLFAIKITTKNIL